jgi:hypothetical protein
MGWVTQPLQMWQQWETTLIFCAITSRLFSLLPGHKYWQCNLALQNIIKTGATVSVSHSCGLLLYDSTVHKDTQLEGAHSTQPDTVKPTCQYTVPMYDENALAKVKISLWICITWTQHCCCQAILSDTKMFWGLILLCGLSYNWSTTTSKANYLQSANQCFPFQFSVSTFFLKVIQLLVTSSSSSSHP